MIDAIFGWLVFAAFAALIVLVLWWLGRGIAKDDAKAAAYVESLRTQAMATSSFAELVTLLNGIDGRKAYSQRTKVATVSGYIRAKIDAQMVDRTQLIGPYNIPND